MIYFVNGQYLEDEAATVPVTDHSFLYGDGCFEGIGVYRGRILHLNEHVERFFLSAKMLRIDVGMTQTELTTAIVRTAGLNDMATLPMGYLRPLVSRGSGPLGVAWSSKLGPATVVVIPQISGRDVAYGETGSKPLTAVTSSFVKQSPSALEPRIKSNNYLTSVLAYLEAEDRGADVAVLRDSQGFVTEGHAMNVFAVLDEVVVAPPAGVALAGITRSKVLATARSLGHPVEERPMTIYDLICADEVFVTSSLDGVTAVGSIDGRLLPAAPGRLTEQIRSAYSRSAYETATPVPSLTEVE